MIRAQLEHVIRAAATIAQDDEIVVIGSHAILGRYPDAPPELCLSKDADVYPRNHPERSELIDGSIGELSPFHETFGYYAQGVGERTATLPAGWEKRLIAVPTAAGTGLCLEPHDLVISKYVAGREKDRDYSALLRGTASSTGPRCSNAWSARTSMRLTVASSSRRSMRTSRHPPDRARPQTNNRLARSG